MRERARRVVVGERAREVARLVRGRRSRGRVPEGRRRVVGTATPRRLQACSKHGTGRGSATGRETNERTIAAWPCVEEHRDSQAIQEKWRRHVLVMDEQALASAKRDRLVGDEPPRSQPSPPPPPPSPPHLSCPQSPSHAPSRPARRPRSRARAWSEGWRQQRVSVTTQGRKTIAHGVFVVWVSARPASVRAGSGSGSRRARTARRASWSSRNPRNAAVPDAPAP